MERDKIIKIKKRENKIKIIILSILVSIILFISIDNGESYKYNQSNESKYLIEDIDIEFRYDEDNYEVSSVINNPYAIARGESSKINLLKLKKGYNFYIDLTDAKEGEYNLNVLYEGIDKDLSVDIYPLIVNVSLIEKKVLSYEPVIEIVGNDKLKDKDLIAGIPEVIDNVKSSIRETQENLGNIGSVKGVVDVSNFTKTTTVDVELNVYDREGNRMDNINLLDDVVKVKVPIEKRVIVETVIEEVVENVIIKEIIETNIIENIIENNDEKELNKLKNYLEDLNLEVLEKDKEINLSRKELEKNSVLIKELESVIKTLEYKIEEYERENNEVVDEETVE